MVVIEELDIAMEVRQLDLFLRVAELGSINRAAQTLQLSQPALSRQIALLEQDMGVLLFSRSQGGVLLTDAGRLLSDRARPLLRQFNLLKQQVGEQAAGQLAIGMPPAWRQMVSCPFIEAIAAQLPGVKLRVCEGLSNELQDDMAAGLLDLGIVPFSATPAHKHTQTALLREPIVVVGRASDLMTPDRPVTLADLNARNLVLPERPNVLRVQLEQAMARRSLDCRVAVEADSVDICLDMARRGLALSVVPASALPAIVGDKSFSWSPLRAQQVTWALWENQARAHSEAVAEGRRLLLRHIGGLIKRKQWWKAELLVDLKA
jgi:LysR family transcriptional regulator, nitrogen assimilation regulatory protein